jgi:hypothetical protein
MYMLAIFCFWCAATVIYADLAIVNLPEKVIHAWFLFGAVLLLCTLVLSAT